MNNNKIVLAGLLTLAANLASQAVSAEKNFTVRTQQEIKFYDNKFFKLNRIVRYKTADGRISIGHLFLSMNVNLTKNHLINFSEDNYFGTLMFYSDKKDSSNSNGKKIQTIGTIFGEDGSVMFEKIGTSKTYQFYGCSSTFTSCVSEQIELKVLGKQKYVMSFDLSNYSNVEFLQDELNNIWTKKIETVELQEIKN